MSIPQKISGIITRETELGKIPAQPKAWYQANPIATNETTIKLNNGESLSTLTTTQNFLIINIWMNNTGSTKTIQLPQYITIQSTIMYKGPDISTINTWILSTKEHSLSGEGENGNYHIETFINKTKYDTSVIEENLNYGLLGIIKTKNLITN